MLDEHPNAFDERNLFFSALLGLLSMLDRVEVALTLEAREEAALPSDDPALLAALGVVAFRLRLREHLAPLVSPPPAPPRPAAPPPSLRELLR